MFVWPAGQLVILRSNYINVRHHMQTVRSNFLIHAMLIGTFDFYHFVLLSLALTLPGGHKVSAKQICWLHFLTHFSSDEDEI